MKTVMALTMGILIIVYCNCGTASVNSGNNSPQVETGRRLANVSSDSTNTAVTNK
ncbi:MAG: hypothetical protein ABUT20_06780 [Bacteroidota bacterium]